MHDFLIKKLGRAVPCGIYDLAANAGWVSVGIDRDTGLRSLMSPPMIETFGVPVAVGNRE